MREKQQHRTAHVCFISDLRLWDEDSHMYATCPHEQVQTEQNSRYLGSSYLPWSLLALVAMVDWEYS